jgi:hypothetical protein
LLKGCSDEEEEEEEEEEEVEEVFVSPDSVLGFFKQCPGTRSSPSVLLDIADDDPDDPPTVQVEVIPP